MNYTEQAPEIVNVFQRVLESIVYPSGKRTGSQIEMNLKDAFVPLRSNVTVDARIHGGEMDRLRVCLSDFCYLEVNPNEDLSAQLSPTENLIADSLGQLSRSVQSAISGESNGSVPLLPRRLIDAPFWSDGRRDKLAALDVPSALSMFHRVVLLGTPGSGKSTVLRAISAHLLSSYEKERQQLNLQIGMWSNSRNIPIFVELREFVNSDSFRNAGPKVETETLLRFLEKNTFFGSSGTIKHVQEAMLQGRAVLLLDGFDEVPIEITKGDEVQQRLQQLKELIQSIGLRFPKLDMIVSSRPAGYSGHELEGFETVRMLPLNPSESRSLAASIFKSKHLLAEEVEPTVDEFLRQIVRVPEELARQPLFFCLLAVLFEDRRNDELPTRRGALLEETIDFLLSSWAIKTYDGRSFEEVVGCGVPEILEALSNIGFEANQVAEAGEKNIPRGLILEKLYDVRSEIDFRKLFEFVSIHAGILVERSPTEFRFAHGQFQEYLAARKLYETEQGPSELLALLETNFARWIEVSRLLCDLFVAKQQREKAWSLVDSLISHKAPELNWLGTDLFLTCLHSFEEKDEIFAATKRKILRKGAQTLRRKNRGLSQAQVCDFVKCLSRLGDSRKGVGLKSGLPELRWVRLSGGMHYVGTSAEEEDILRSLGAEGWQFTLEKDKHQVNISDFEISTYPVTTAQFYAFLTSDDGYKNNNWWPFGSNAKLQSPESHPCILEREGNEPATFVTWFEAVAFAKWLSDRTDSSLRLPTEVEWEISARSPSSTIFRWGNGFRPDLANTREAALGKVVGVGCFPSWSNGGGEEFDVAVDMVGNCWEWCSSIVESGEKKPFLYPYSPNDGREEMVEDGSNLRATRGGFFGNPQIVARPAYRGRDLPGSRLARQGFRLVRDVDDGGNGIE